MEKIKEQLLQSLKEKQLLAENYSVKMPFPEVIIIESFNWDYQKAYQAQKESLQFIFDHPKLMVFFICSHPHVFTYGRGLQKTKNQSLNLKESSPSDLSHLSYPIEMVDRGGGLTFHYPGAYTFYPMLNLKKYKLDVPQFINKFLNLIKSFLNDSLPELNLKCQSDPAGLWKDQYKIGSVGLNLRRLISYHGFSINLFEDPSFFNDIKDLHPCGLSGSLFKSIQSLYPDQLPFQNMEEFQTQFYPHLEKEIELLVKISQK